MKNISLSLCIIFLFGIYFPMHQAYANSKKALSFEKVQAKISNNEDLVDKLVNSKTFKSTFYSLFVLTTVANYNMSIKTKKQFNESMEKLENVKNAKNVKLNDVCNLLGFKIDKEADAKIIDSFKNLKIEFPELVMMDKEQMEEIINRALVKGDFLNKAILAIDMNSCMKTSVTNYGNCLTHGRWYKSAMAGFMAAAYIAAFTCLVGVTLVTAGTADAAVVGLMVTFCAGIGALCADSWLLRSSETIKKSCGEVQNSELTLCQLYHGTPSSGGAE